MEKLLEYFKVIVACVSTGVTWLVGAWDMAIIILVSFMAIDYITGVIKAYINKEVSSDIGRRGIAKKAGMLIVLIVAVMLDRLINTGTWVFRTAVCYFYIANEGISLLENLGAIGVPIPAKMAEALKQLSDREKEVIE